jgi:hypothetical protein
VVPEVIRAAAAADKDNMGLVVMATLVMAVVQVQVVTGDSVVPVEQAVPVCAGLSVHRTVPQ